jgi:hypothetical protein
MDIISWYKDIEIYSSAISTWLFVFAAGVLFYRAKSFPTAIFFSGLFVKTCLNTRVLQIFSLHQTNTAGFQLFYKLAMYRDIAFIVAVIGFLWFVFTGLENKKANTV